MGPPDHRAAIAAVFDAAADTYDNVGVEFFQPIADQLVHELAPQAGESCLDVGCGRGQVLFQLARRVGPTGRAVGIDLAPRMVAATSADANAMDLPIEVRVGDAQDPDVDGLFDIVAASLVLFFVPDPVAALRAWRARLVAAGRVGISTFGDFVTPAWRAVDEVFAPYMASQGNSETSDAPDPFSSIQGVQRLVLDAGFSEVGTTSTVVSVRFDDPDHWYRWTLSHAQRGRWQAVPMEARAEVTAKAYEALEASRDEDGRIGFDQTVHFTLGRS